MNWKVLWRRSTGDLERGGLFIGFHPNTLAGGLAASKPAPAKKGCGQQKGGVAFQKIFRSLPSQALQTNPHHKGQHNNNNHNNKIVLNACAMLA